MKDLEALKDQLKAKIQSSRVGDEMQNMSGQFFAGTIWRSVLISFLTASMILATMSFLLSQMPHCSVSCFRYRPETCCLFDGLTWITLGILALTAFFGSFLLTKTSRQQHFQLSAWTSTFVLIVSGLVSFGASVPVLFSIATLLVVFVSLFWGYRAGL